MFWVMSVYFNIRNTLPKSGTFLLGHPVYVVRRLRVNFRLISASIAYDHNTQSAVIITALRVQEIQLISVVAFLFRQSQPQHTNKTQLRMVIFTGCNMALPVPEAARSKTWVCGRSPAEIVTSNPTGGVEICLV